MESGIEQRIRELLVAELRSDPPGETHRVELSGVTLELRVERVVVELGRSDNKR